MGTADTGCTCTLLHLYNLHQSGPEQNKTSSSPGRKDGVSDFSAFNMRLYSTVPGGPVWSVADRGSECSLLEEAPTAAAQAADHVSPVSLPHSDLKHHPESNLKCFK